MVSDSGPLDLPEDLDEPAVRRALLDELTSRAKQLERHSQAEFALEVRQAAEDYKAVVVSVRSPQDAAKRLLMWHEQNKLCTICGQPITEDQLQATDVDHKIPHVFGGGNEYENLELTHLKCNRRKRHSVDPHDVLDYLEGKLPE